ncbi:hypothetical protein CERZMDRAFT_95951 [Cercospora zeae-maydis SCOH1-5]|uniref:Uncharacterized protein n=1 Tax=Cercospora zeae-maydis SCOH1-5 TaxID=717836 RepID=A0A6A6FKV8_9PEZI|nr:hypothetical protein CERZMDRAFT_95951 [Cercospora zeae-maydis SCOH1-5]
MQDLYATIEETALGFVASLGNEARDTYLAPEFEATYAPLQQVLPHDTPVNELDNPTYTHYFSSQLDRLAIEADKRLLDSVIDPKKRKAWLWYQLEFKDAEELWAAPFEKIVMEVVWMMELTEDGKKIVRCRQYLDTVACDTFFPGEASAVQAAQENFPATDLDAEGTAHTQVTSLVPSDDEDTTDEFLKGLTVSRN